MPSRDELACLKRADLQRLCKSYGIRANLKSEELVELLLQESSGPSKFPSHAGPSTPPLLSRTTSVRVLSRTPSTRSRLNTAHTTLNQLEREAGCTAATAHPAPVSQSDGVANGPATRTRKAKDTQFRLGVGRPTAAGGSGARSITKSASLGKLRRGRISRSGKPSEATIPEESTADVEMGNVPIPAATKKHVLPISSQSSMNPTGTLTDLRPLLRAYLEQELQPFNATISALRLELQEQATTHQNEMNSLKDRLELLTVELDALRRENTSNLDDINGKIERLQTENARARGSVDPITDPFNSPVPARQSTDGSQPPDATTLKLTTHGLTRTIRPSTKFEYPPPPSTKKASKESGYHVLGKRPRPPENSEPGPSRTTNSRTSAAQAEQFEASDEATSPSRKRPRLESDEIGVHVAKSSFPTFAPPLPSESRHPSSDTPRPGFSVYSGPEESLQANNALRAPLDEQFFAESDFDYFDSQQSTRQGSHVTSTSNAIENNPFAFALTTSLSRTLTPTTTAAPAPAELESDDTPVINNFPYPQAPHSPSPAPHRSSTRPPDSSRSTASSIPAESSGNSGNVHPVAVPPPRTPPPNTGSIEQQAFRRIAGSDIGFGFGPGVSFHTPTGPAGRTLYGTELDVDQRFGDFGYDGVASGFWSGS